MAASFSASQHIEKSPETVYAAITDLDGWSNWIPGLVRIERLSDGAFGVGTKWREVRKVFGREGQEVFEVTGVEAGKGYDLFVDGSLGTTGKGAYRFSHLVEARDDGAVLTISGEIEMPGLVFKLLGGLLVGTFRKAIEKDLLALKGYLEST